MKKPDFQHYLSGFKLYKNSAAVKREYLSLGGVKYPVFRGEFWTSQQRQANAIHEVSYRACFKPQLPHFFIDFFTQPGEVVYDPFNGRGTTVIEAALMGRNISANDVNPLSLILTRPRINPPLLKEVEKRLNEIVVKSDNKADIDLSMFYHPVTEAELVSLRNYLRKRAKAGKEDTIDQWIRMVATNRLSGHSKGFFSVYTLPPNQAVTQEQQQKINLKRKQKPEYRDVKKLILKKSKGLLKELNAEQKKLKPAPLFMNGDASQTGALKSNSVALTVTSPPFLDIVQYANDNWLRCWFNDIDVNAVAKKITMSKTVKDWSDKMQMVFNELYRVTKKNGVVAFEVGEVRNGKVRLEEVVVPLGINAGFTCEAVLINEQQFTKTSNIWGVSNNKIGTNSNRIVVFRK